MMTIATKFPNILTWMYCQKHPRYVYQPIYIFRKIAEAWIFQYKRDKNLNYRRKPAIKMNAALNFWFDLGWRLFATFYGFLEKKLFGNIWTICRILCLAKCTHYNIYIHRFLLKALLFFLWRVEPWILKAADFDCPTVRCAMNLSIFSCASASVVKFTRL